MGATPSRITDPALSRGVPNPFGPGGWEPNTQIYDPSNDPLMAGSRKQVTGVGEYEHQAADAEAAAATDASLHGKYRRHERPGRERLCPLVRQRR
jgi:hypothetical protein